MPATDQFWRDLKMMHVVFAVSCIALLGATLWMMADDHINEWRPYQQQFDRIKVEKSRHQENRLKADAAYKTLDDRLNQELEQANQSLRDSENSTLSAIVEQRQQALAAQSDVDVETREAQQKQLDTLVAAVAQADAGAKTLAEVRKELENLLFEADAVERQAKVQRAIRDVARANFDLGIRDMLPEERLNPLATTFESEQTKVDELELEVEQRQAEVQRVQAIVSAVEAPRDVLLAEQKEHRSDVDQLVSAREKIQPESWFSRGKRRIMDWYIIDGFNSPHKVAQDWLPDLRVQLGMAEIARFDRCRTCHTGIDVVETGNAPAFPLGHPESHALEDWVASNQYPHPFATHPRPELYLTAASPHPTGRFGCTVCHEGQGSGTSFNNAEHTPNNPHEQELWEDEYHFHANHFWEYPMLPERFQESTCLKCHHQVTELGVNPTYGPTAPKVYEGYQLIEKYGCFGCHEINGFDAGKSIGPDIRLEPQTDEERAKIAGDPNQVAGLMRKVGPSLRHIGSKTTKEWIEFWTEEPKRFRPATRMPQFFNLSNQRDAHAQEFMPVEIAGITSYLLANSVELQLLEPASDYTPNAKRGQNLFAQRGCLACHSHAKFPDTSADFGPDLSRVHEKIKPGEDGFRWLYTWIQDPMRHHPRTKMPVLFLQPETVQGELVDPAADIAAFLLQGGPGSFPGIEVGEHALDELVRTYLASALTEPQVEQTMSTRRYALPRDLIKGDEIELTHESAGAEPNDAQWRQMKLNYVGRKTISRYGCYGCHDVAGFESARPIGTALQDWGRKDTSRLAPEHIEEYLHHHGEPLFGTWPDRKDAGPGYLVADVIPGGPAALAGLKVGDRVVKIAGKINDEPVEFAIGGLSDVQDTTYRFEPGAEVQLTVQREKQELMLPLEMHRGTQRRVATAMMRANAGIDAQETAAHREHELSAAYFYENLLHHGRPGFIWQKLREPRSYDYEKIETKSYVERLRMPEFPFDEQQIEAISTFVLGLVADPPAAHYVYAPTGPPAARIEGERLLDKFNCTGCHVLELPQFKYAVDPQELAGNDELTPDEYPEAKELLLQLKPPRNADTGETLTIERKGEDGEPPMKVTLPIINPHGMVRAYPDPEDEPEFQEYSVVLWETIEVQGQISLPTSPLLIPASQLVEMLPARGGSFAEWLVKYQMQNGGPRVNLDLAWQMGPPPLYKEGIKVQTPWLYRFLLDPGRLRHTTVLRMPKFNMSADEAQALANYFAAVDNVPYPYQPIPEREPEYLALRNAEFGLSPDSGSSYLAQAWKLLNAPLCIKCHSVGGREVKITNPQEDIRGPNLDLASDRLRPDWLLAWLFKPAWLTPYTSMPAPFLRSKASYPEILDGDGKAQTIAVRDALMNYHRLMEEFGETAYEPQEAASTGAGGD